MGKTAHPYLSQSAHQIFISYRKDQESSNQKYSRFFVDADIIAGDYLAINRYMPPNMKGKVVITNTVTLQNVEDLKQRGARYLITTTPQFQGRSFGTNVYEATLLAISGKKPEELKPQDYLELAKKSGFKPRIERLN